MFYLLLLFSSCFGQKVKKEEIREDFSLRLANALNKSRCEYNNTPGMKLLKASKDGDEEGLKNLIDQQGVSIEFEDLRGKTALIHASENGQKVIVEFLLSKGNIDIDKADKNKKTALIYASENKHNEIVKLFISAKADINKADYEGYTALMYAVLNEDKVIVELLLSQKDRIDIDKLNNKKQSALMLAAVWGNKELVKILLKSGADVNIVDEMNRTALSLAEEKKLTAESDAKVEEYEVVIELLKNKK